MILYLYQEPYLISDALLTMIAFKFRGQTSLGLTVNVCRIYALSPSLQHSNHPLTCTHHAIRSRQISTWTSKTASPRFEWTSCARYWGCTRNWVRYKFLSHINNPINIGGTTPIAMKYLVPWLFQEPGSSWSIGKRSKVKRLSRNSRKNLTGRLKSNGLLVI